MCHTRGSHRRAEGRDSPPVPRVVCGVKAEGGVAHTRWPSRYGLRNQPARTSTTVRLCVCASPLALTRARVLTVCRETQDACVRLKTGQSLTTETALNVTLRCRTKGKLCEQFLAHHIKGLRVTYLCRIVRHEQQSVFCTLRGSTTTALTARTQRPALSPPYACMVACCQRCSVYVAYRTGP